MVPPTPQTKGNESLTREVLKIVVLNFSELKLEHAHLAALRTVSALGSSPLVVGGAGAYSSSDGDRDTDLNCFITYAPRTAGVASH